MSAGWPFTLGGYLTGLAIWVLAARRRGLVTEGMGWLLVAGMLGGSVGAMAGQFVTAGPGRSLQGGLAGGWLAVVLAKRRLGLRRSTGDLFALALPAGEAVGRLGCFVNGCCYGRATGVPWAVLQHGAWRHPTQLYSAAAAASIFLWLVGQLDSGRVLFPRFLVAYGVSRLVIEHFREALSWAGLSPAQWVCVGMIVYGLVRVKPGKAAKALGNG